MCLEGLSMFLLSIILQSCDLQKPITVAACELSTVVIKLAIINVFFMLSL